VASTSAKPVTARLPPAVVAVLGVDVVVVPVPTAVVVLGVVVVVLDVAVLKPVTVETLEVGKVVDGKSSALRRVQPSPFSSGSHSCMHWA